MFPDELADESPDHAVSGWLAHSEDIAKEHYRQVTDEHFERATSFFHDAISDAA